MNIQGRIAPCLAAMALALPISAHAQLRAPALGPESVAITSIRALVLHDGDREDLVLELAYQADPAPAEVAWIVPLPSSAEWFGTVEGDPFEALGTTPPAAPLAPLAPLAMQPLRARGEEGVRTLAQWLSDGGLRGWTDEELAYYGERDWTFFASRARPSDGTALPTSARLPPLHLTFRSERAIVPLRLADARGATVSVTLLTSVAPDRAALSAAVAQGFEIESGTLELAAVMGALRAVLDRSSAFPAGEVAGGVLARTTLSAARLGDARRWAEELSVPGAARRERIEGIADREPGPELPLAVPVAEEETVAPVIERTASAPAAEPGDAPSSSIAWIVAAVTALLLALGALAWRRRRTAD